jgi:hypothetical protein
MNWGGDWLPRDTNFDNIIEGMLAMFKVALTEGWLDIMAWGDDIVGIEKVSKIDNQLWPALFFSIFIVIGSFFILNLFDGIVIDNFNNERNKHNGLEEFSNK